MRWKTVGLALLVVVVSAILGATVLREPIANAAKPVFTDVIVGNTVDQPVPVAQEGIADVNISRVTAPLTVAQAAVTEGGGIFKLSDKNPTSPLPSGYIGALSMHMSSNVGGIEFFNGTNLGAVFLGQATGHGADIDIALARPLKWSEARCLGDGPRECVIGFVGGGPG